MYLQKSASTGFMKTGVYCKQVYNSKNIDHCVKTNTYYIVEGKHGFHGFVYNF
jgi:hypothetical protein